MPDTIYVNDTRDLAYDIYVRDRDTRQITRPTVVSGMFALLNCSGEYIVPLSTATVSNQSRLSFRVRPSSGTAEIGAYSEIWIAFIGQEVVSNVQELLIRERY